MYATKQDAARAAELPPLEPTTDRVTVKRVDGIAGKGRATKVVDDGDRKPEAAPGEGLGVLGLYVVARLREAGNTLTLMPGIGGGYSEREFPLPDPEAITRMDEVLQVWMGWCRTMDERRLLGWFIAGLSWRKAAKKDPHRRSHETLRKAFGKVIEYLVQQVEAKGHMPPKWLLTELAKRG
ncbi:MAG: hypothetical protein ACM31D_04665 [Bacteroidota bacterium]